MKKKKEKKIHARELGINLKPASRQSRFQKESELFKWFLACLLFGKPIQQGVAKRTYFEFEKERLLTPEKILKAGWEKLVEVLDRGHYVRYDFSTATKLLDVCKELKNHYGSLHNLFQQARNKKDLEKRLQEFKGIGPKTTKIFLRDIY
ncbi:MAG: DNA methylase [Patescibacteria group bacterium]